jgi:hypothetical protein
MSLLIRENREGSKGQHLQIISVMRGRVIRIPSSGKKQQIGKEGAGHRGGKMRRVELGGGSMPSDYVLFAGRFEIDFFHRISHLNSFFSSLRMRRP